MGFTEWFAMGGYGWFVWLSYGIAIVVLGWNIYMPIRDYRRFSELFRQDNTHSRDRLGSR